MFAFINAFLIDGNGAAPVKNATVLVEDKHIRAVGKNITVPEAAEVIDLHGRTLMPGITEAHIHFGGPKDFLSPPLLGSKTTECYAAARHTLLDFGITNARGGGDYEDDTLLMRDMINKNKLEGPRIWSPGKAFQPIGGHPAYTVWQADPDILAHAITSPCSIEDVQLEVRRQAAAGVNHIKCFLADDNYSDPSNKSPKLDEKLLTAIINEAHALGLHVMVHCQEPAFALQALHAGADSIEHLICAGHDDLPLPEGLSDAFLENDAFLVPTLIAGVCFGLSKSALDFSAAAVKTLFDAGVKIAVGTDTGTPKILPGISTHMEIELLVDAGIPQMDALVCATLNGAELVGSDEFGTIQSGKLADIIVVDGNPLDNISCTKNILFVMKDGSIARNNIIDIFE